MVKIFYKDLPYYQLQPYCKLQKKEQNVNLKISSFKKQKSTDLERFELKTVEHSYIFASFWYHNIPKFTYFLPKMAMTW